MHWGGDWDGKRVWAVDYYYIDEEYITDLNWVWRYEGLRYIILGFVE